MLTEKTRGWDISVGGENKLDKHEVHRHTEGTRGDSEEGA